MTIGVPGMKRKTGLIHVHYFNSQEGIFHADLYSYPSGSYVPFPFPLGPDVKNASRNLRQ